MTVLDRTNSSNITVRQGLRELDKWKPAVTEDQWKQAKLVVLEDNAQDELRCTLTPTGIFSVAEYVKSFRATRPKKEWTDTVWNKFTSFRVNAFSWRVRRGAIPVDKNIQKRGTSKCVCCSNPRTETLEHLMINSDIARLLWDHFATKLHINLRAQSIDQMYRTWLYGVNRRSQLGMTYHSCNSSIRHVGDLESVVSYEIRRGAVRWAQAVEEDVRPYKQGPLC